MPIHGNSVGFSRGARHGIHGDLIMLHSRDVVSTGAGAMIGFSLCGSRVSDFIAGGAVVTLIIIWLSTPKAIDIQSHFFNFDRYHSHRFNRKLHLLTIWPQLLSAMII